MKFARTLLPAALLAVSSSLYAHNIVPSALTVGTDYFSLGLGHLWGGWDHLAFLAGLLLPGGNWVQMVKIVTAFTISHSLTLSLAATGRLVAPSWLVEPLIALTIVLVAIEALRRPNLLAPRPDRRFELALVFGLIHGFGFAGALGEVGLPQGRILPALAGFNLGLEAAQLSVVVVFLPLLAGIQVLSSRVHGSVVAAATVAVGALGSVWFLERVLGGLL